jgi:hypothetical protein
VQTATPDIHHPARHRVDRGRVPWALLTRGPGLSRRPLDLATTAAFVLGGALLVWSAAIHYHLWSEPDGYRSIATIGPLFLLQSISGLVIGVGVVAVRRVWAALIGIGFALGTVAGFLVSVTHGLFGFTESWLAPFAQQAFVIELVAVGLLAVAGVLCLAGSPRARPGPESDPGT